MKIIQNIWCLILISISINGFGQVQFGIEYQEANQKYVISLRSIETIPTPLNSTGTAQVTIKTISSDSFLVGHLTSLLPNVNWMKTTRVNHPTEATDYDYITFGLTSLGTSLINYQKDSITRLFSFKNVGGACPGSIEIIDNQTDDFLYPNSEKLSIKNHISILGAGGNAYIGNYLSQTDCQSSPPVFTSTKDIKEFQISLYPNPTTDWLVINFDLSINNNHQIKIYDLLGRVVLNQSLRQGQTIQELDISELAKGSYFLMIEGMGYQSSTKAFIKSE